MTYLDTQQELQRVRAAHLQELTDQQALLIAAQNAKITANVKANEVLVSAIEATAVRLSSFVCFDLHIPYSGGLWVS